jgi:jumonji domain-containing protein 2
MPPAWYGADEEGSLFGDDPASGWSLANLDSCLHVLSHVPGVTSPYLYCGMWASVFCAHTEDMNLLSVNYLHAGAPKVWYAVAPGPDAARLESLTAFHYAHEDKLCKQFLRHKMSLLSPIVLRKAGIPFTTVVQRPGEAVITFPGGYHFGFNSGFNVAEATNFGTYSCIVNPFISLTHYPQVFPNGFPLDCEPKFVCVAPIQLGSTCNK